MTATYSATAILAQSSGGAGVPIRELLLVLCTAAVVTYLATGAVRLLALRFGAVAIPRDRDVHVEPTPRLGGVGMYIGMAVGLLFAQQLPALTRGFEFGNPDVHAALVAGAVIVLVGVIDDKWGLDALTKFVGQVTAAGILVVMGVSWFIIYNPFGEGSTIILDQIQSGLFTVAIAVATINAMNFVDGLDGLAAGLGLIAAVAILIFSIGLLHDQGGDVSAYPPAMIAAALAGACLGFLPHNFNPARIFMGDSGSMLIGLMLAAISTSASGRIPLTAYGTRDLVGLLAPLLLVSAVMFIPMLDMLLAVIRRTRAGVSPFSPDKMHLHHRLLQIGHTHRRVVLVIYSWVGVLAFGAVGSALLNRQLVVVLVAAGLLAAFLFTAIPSLRDRQQERR
ncbi:undecaprenyl-phosphate alpha-N-acetylglucosaminyl 1-phosphate transferase [Rhodococcus sp. SRB_17]|uniref:glycosyltransferase family 4 protein n=1 Tax=Rhodococcus sp. OK302 TaxID=1882769 RepID=UPI000B93A1ED|nr:MraY family glycosyltransferase [Rhodococcus sp. OK302]NMM86059.1 undecaprenyl-phosphate alpha-N-acetylglucosaminyl 1-phosphate transferase [Rhodococcus sp. SRB_17]OYD71274.1 UDP-GlcNAc:undecaprenyl-phosphate GlcNAc-1-phosphate transferase [Rhodococcus sp. OK302]